MEIAVLSDIHGNYVALERCLNYAFTRGVQTFILLGDYIGELAYPKRTMQILYDLRQRYQCYFIRGNKEEYWLNYRANGEKGWKDKSSTTGALLYAYNALSESDFEFFSKLKPTQTLLFNQMPAILICHGSPYKVNEKMLPDDNRTIEVMNSVRESLILCGHTHRQQKITHNKTNVLNPGSVGMPQLSEGKTQFLILHGLNDEWWEEFISLSYDVERVIHELYESKLDVHAPYWSYITKHNLRTGLVSHEEILVKAIKLCKEEIGECIWPDVPERYWAKVVGELLSARCTAKCFYI